MTKIRGTFQLSSIKYRVPTKDETLMRTSNSLNGTTERFQLNFQWHINSFTLIFTKLTIASYALK